MHPVANREIYILGMVSGPACSKNERKSLDFHTFGGEQTETKTETFDEISRSVVPRALKDTRKIRKAGADMFANVRPKKPEQKNGGKHNARNRTGIKNNPKFLRILDNKVFG